MDNEDLVTSNEACKYEEAVVRRLLFLLAGYGREKKVHEQAQTNWWL